MKYPKINSIWKRVDQKGALIEGDHSIPEFANIKRWRCHEKIDGTNIRIHYNKSHIIFYGRSDEAMIPRKLDNYLKEHFTHALFEEFFPLKEGEELPEMWLFGEGYGPQIQAGGGNYRKDVGFILFDVVIVGANHRWWLEQDSVKEIAEALNIPYAPLIGIMTEEEIVSYIKSKPLSTCSITPQVMEGVIARPEQLLLLRDGSPLLMKVKCRDF
jgi:ATP-dependent RNA circularization protein (DNA/RNA ligase family)